MHIAPSECGAHVGIGRQIVDHSELYRYSSHRTIIIIEGLNIRRVNTVFMSEQYDNDITVIIAHTKLLFNLSNRKRLSY